MKQFEVKIPDEKPRIIEFIQENLPGIAYVNRSLIDFEPKGVFSWQLSILFDLQDPVENGMPSKHEQGLLDEFGEILDASIKGKDKKKPNALFLARITWNRTRELIWRVYDPEPVDNYLQQVISDNLSPRPFDYRMDSDEKWKLAEWHLAH